MSEIAANIYKLLYADNYITRGDIAKKIGISVFKNHYLCKRFNKNFQMATLDVITQNPYRVLGVFANDSMRTVTASIAKIRAFNKVEKVCSFESDFTDIFGQIDRSEESIKRATTLLSSDEDRDFYSLFWIHREQNLNIAAKAPVDIIRSEWGGGVKLA